MSILNNFNTIFRNDSYIKNLCKSSELEYEEVKKLAQRVYLNMFFDTLDKEAIQIYAKVMDVVIDNTLPLENQRSILVAKWKSKGKCTEDLIQTVCNSWKNREITVSFEDTINVNFNSLGGIPNDIETLKSALDKVKPAYLLIKYTFNWLYWDMWEGFELNWNQLESKNLTWDKLEGTVFKP